MKKFLIIFAIASAVLALLYPIAIKLAKMYDNDMLKARQEEMKNMAIKLKIYGDSTDKIAKITGLSIREIDPL